MANQRTKRSILRFGNIRNTMVFYFAVLIISALLIFLLISLNYTQRTVLENSTEYTSQLVEQVNAQIDSYINYMENIAEIVTYDAKVTGNIDAERSISLFQTVIATREDICNIALIREEGEPVINNGDDQLNPYVDLEQVDWYTEAKEAGGATVVSSSHVQNLVLGKYEWVVTLSKSLSSKNGGQGDSVFFIDLNYNAINDLCESVTLGSKGYIYIVDQQGNIIYHPQQLLLFSSLKEELIDEVLTTAAPSFLTNDAENSKLYTLSRSEKTGWLVVGVVSVDELMKDRDSTQVMYVLTAAVLLLAALIISYLVSRQITRPIELLTDSMKEVEKGNFDNITIPDTYENEIGSLSKSFQRMIQEIQNLMKQNVEEQKKKRKSELRALQSQINPHFLYNTLDSIIWMSEWGKNKEAVLMASSLARLFRQSISNEHEELFIEDEMDYVNSYLTIQRMRYKDKLDYSITIEEEVKKYKIVKLTLQPLVENAIYHGIKYKEDSGFIQITGQRIGEDIFIQIIDDGIGMDEERLSHIFDKKPSGSRSNQVGVYNVQNRLQLYYGKNYGLSYESTLGEGTVVSIHIPITKEDRNEKE